MISLIDFHYPAKIVADEERLTIQIDALLKHRRKQLASSGAK